ncbi:unnamed protein product [Paramecium pentaurelia]|uniref:Kazal-like domain-containing protein n=1 Tax=Paramecium pentaurelia TaxID=43138 RepID=A0A8S1YDH6_9CILI|nr:unnamed protein product [Paramecium pentaurelia]
MFIIFLFCITTTLSSFINCPEQTQQYCDDNYHPVCAYVQDEKIAKQYQNACEACKISTTQYYYEGECKQLKNHTQIYRLTTESNEQSDLIKDCDENIRYLTDCSNKESLVCGVFTSTENCTTCQNEYYNFCVACADQKVDYYYDGYCKNEQTKSEIIYCPADRPSNCDENGQSVCSQTTYPCSTQDCVLESKSWCAACSNSQVITYYQGSCQKYLEYAKNVNIMEEVAQKCNSLQPETCTETVQEVCATETCNDDGLICQKTYSNSCLACKNTKVISYLPFSCFSYQQFIIWSMIIYFLQ